MRWDLLLVQSMYLEEWAILKIPNWFLSCLVDFYFLFNYRTKFYCHHLIRMGVGYEQYARKISYILWHRWEFLSKPTFIILISWICSLSVTLCFTPIGWLHPCRECQLVWGDIEASKIYWGTSSDASSLLSKLV